MSSLHRISYFSIFETSFIQGYINLLLYHLNYCILFSEETSCIFHRYISFELLSRGSRDTVSYQSSPRRRSRFHGQLSRIFLVCVCVCVYMRERARDRAAATNIYPPSDTGERVLRQDTFIFLSRYEVVSQGGRGLVRLKLLRRMQWLEPAK